MDGIDYELMVPAHEAEIAALGEQLTPAGKLILRKLAFQRDDLRAQLAAAVEKARKPHPKCPACHGGGTFQASDEGGMWVACDCAANIYLKLEQAERERDEAIGKHLPPGLMGEYHRLDAMWQDLVRDRDRLAVEVVALRLVRDAAQNYIDIRNEVPLNGRGQLRHEHDRHEALNILRAALSQPAQGAQGEAPADAKGGEA